jgi:uncharacterized membrane protein YuzA (DUF378 family)
MNTLDWIAWVLVVVGALNWGLVGAFNYNLVEALLGFGMLTQWVYILVGVGGLYFLYQAFTMKSGKKK